MSTEQQMDDRAEFSDELARLRSRVRELEAELVSLQAWANEIVADAQQRTYWLDRLHLDLDPIMRHVPFDSALSVYKQVRGVYRRLYNVSHRILRLLDRRSS